ncbi:WD repeat-containing protein 87 [Meriones unguiculatus]|uniref:WD repeat-containing protein 87 n=1 Tax=Meriones unguiculatus TaxID=10047 RepID=UPI00293E2561|nr:WD repeat-containing protein 87 [Meriones unguiculatus]
MTTTRLVPQWNEFMHLVNEAIQKSKNLTEIAKNEVVVLSDRAKILFKETYSQTMPIVCHYFIEAHFFAALSWVSSYTKEILAVVWMKNENDGMVERKTFPMNEQLPPIKLLVHAGSFHVIVAYCGDMILRLFGDHFRAFQPLSTVPCRFDISCLCFDPVTGLLLAGTLGAVVSWVIEQKGKGLQMTQIFSIPGDELVQKIVQSGPNNQLVALCETALRVLEYKYGRLEEAQKFIATSSGSPITCCFTSLERNLIYAGNKSGHVHVWKVGVSQALHSFRAHPSPVICVHGRAEAHTLLTACKEGVIKEWNLTSGTLLRQLVLTEELWDLQFIDSSTFFCQTAQNFTLRHLPCFYSLFNICGSAPQQLSRIRCKDSCYRILCATEDGLLRFVSPVTGDLLMLTWPLKILDRAVDWAYDPNKEELVVATGTSQVLVFDTTRNPCPVKYLLCASPDDHDFIQCLAYGNFYLGRGLEGLVFSGHQSGMVKVLSQHSCARVEKVMHYGAVLAMSALYGGLLSSRENSLLCSYGMDDYIQLSETVFTGARLQFRTLASILSSCPLRHLVLLPRAVGAITDTNCLRLWKFRDFLSFGSDQGTRFIETLPLHQCPIVSFDVCLPLSLFATRGSDGSVRLWDFHGRLLAMLDSSLYFGPVCFLNDRADLLITFNQGIYLVPCLKLLPPITLTHLTLMSITDDMVEIPKPFSPSFFLSFETIFVPKYTYQDYRKQELEGLASLVNKRAIAFDNNVPHVVEEEYDGATMLLSVCEEDILEETDVDAGSRKPQGHYAAPPQLQLTAWDGLNPYHILRCYFGHGRKWLLAPDCYIPNSVIRARLWPEGTPVFLQCRLHPPQRPLDWEKSPSFFWKRKKRATSIVDKEDEGFLKKRLTKDITYSVLVDAANRSWLGKKMSEVAINSMVEAILNIMCSTNPLKYQCCIGALGQIFASYQVSATLRAETAHRLLDDTSHSNPQVRELAWEGVKRLGMLSHLFALPLAQGLIDKDQRVREKALVLMPETGIDSKTSLLNLLQKPDLFRDLQQEMIGEESLDNLLGMRPADIQILIAQIERRLSENLGMTGVDRKLEAFSKLPGASAPSKAFVAIPIPEEPEVKTSKSQKRVRAVSKKHARKLMRVFRKAKELAKEKKREESDAGEAETVRSSSSATTSRASEITETDILKDRISVAMRLRKRAKIPEKKAPKLIKHKKKKKEGEEEEVYATEEPAAEPSRSRRRLKASGRGVGGAPGRALPAENAWRDDLCRLVNLRMAGSETGIMTDLNDELVATAKEMLMGKYPSWEIFKDICPFLKDEPQDTKAGIPRQKERPTTGRTIRDHMVVKGEREMPETAEEKFRGEKEVTPKKDKVASLEPGDVDRVRKLKKEEKKAKKKAKLREELAMILRSEKIAKQKEVVERVESEEKAEEEDRKMSWEEWKTSWNEWQELQRQKTVPWENWKKTWDRKYFRERERFRAGEKLLKSEEGKKKLTWDEWKQIWEDVMSKVQTEETLGLGETVSVESEKEKTEPLTAMQKQMLEIQRQARLEWKQARSERERAKEQRLLAQEEEKLAQEEKKLAQEEMKLAQEYVKRAWAYEKVAHLDVALGEKQERLAREEEILSKGAEQLAQKKRKLAREMEKLSHEEEKNAKKREKMAAVQAMLAQKMETVIQKEQSLILKEKELKEAAKRIEWEIRELAWKEDELNEEEERLAQRWEKLAKKEMKLAWQEEHLAMEERMLAQEEKLLIKDEEALAQKEERLPEEEKRLQLRRARLRERKENLAKAKEILAQKMKELEEKKQRLSEDEKTLASEKHILSLEKERLAERGMALSKSEEKILQEKEQVQNVKSKLEEYRQKLENLYAKLEEDKGLLMERRAKLVEVEKEVEQEEMLLAEKQGNLAQEKMKLSDEIQMVIQRSKLFREETEIAEEGTALMGEMEKVVKEKMKLEEEEKLSRRGTEEISQQKRLSISMLDMMKKRISLEEKILTYEDRLLATEEMNAARQGLELVRGERIHAQEERKLAKAVSKLQKEISVSKVLSLRKRSLKELQKLVIKEKAMTQKERKMTKLKRTLFDKEVELGMEEERLDMKELDASEEQPEVIKDERKLAKSERDVAEEMRKLRRQEQIVAKEEREFDWTLVVLPDDQEDIEIGPEEGPESEEETEDYRKSWKRREGLTEPLSGVERFRSIFKRVQRKEGFSHVVKRLVSEVQRESLSEDEREEEEKEEEEVEEEEEEEKVEEEEEEEEKVEEEEEEEKVEEEEEEEEKVEEEEEEEKVEEEEEEEEEEEKVEEEEEEEEKVEEEEEEEKVEEEEEEEKKKVVLKREKPKVQKERRKVPPRKKVFPPIGLGITELRGGIIKLASRETLPWKPSPAFEEVEKKRPFLLEEKQMFREEMPRAFERSKKSLKTKMTDKERQLLEKGELGPLDILDAMAEYEKPAALKPFTTQMVTQALDAHRLHKTSQARKWLFQHHPPRVGKTVGPLPLPEILTEVQRSESGISISEIEWLHRVLKQMAAGEELPRDHFHRLCGLLKDLTSTGDLEWLHLAVLEAIVHRHKQIVDSRSTVTPKPSREPMSPKHLKVIPPIKGKEKESWLKPSAVPAPGSPLATKRVADPKARSWHLLGEPYRSARLQQLSSALEEMETQSFDPTTRELLASVHSSVNEQTLALMLQRDLGDLKGKSRYPKLPKLEKRPISPQKEEVPPWETFVALYYVLRMLQQRHAEDRAAWMENFYQLMDLYQVKSPRIQRLLLDLLLTQVPQAREIVSEKTLKAVELVPGERLLYCLVCGSSHAPYIAVELRGVVPLPEQNNVQTIRPKGIANYGILELAWKSLPQADTHLIKRAPHVTVPTP